MIPRFRRLSIQEKIEAARTLYEARGEELRADSRTASLLERLESEVARSASLMQRVGVAGMCRRCEEQDGGSCCGAGIENRYGPHLLLINMLLGARLPDRRDLEDSCHFLGAEGCKLRVRHTLCVNYLCERIRRGLAEGDLAALQEAVGAELETGFILHERIKRQTIDRT